MLTALLLLALAAADTAPVTSQRTTRSFSLYVSPAGNDKRTCRLVSQPCRSPNAALRRIPKGVNHHVYVEVAAGVYDGGVGMIADHEFGAEDPENPGQIVLRCEQRAAVLDGGSASGTFSAVTNGSGATWASYTDGAQTWVPSSMADGGTVPGGAEGNGFWLALVSGPGSDGGMRLPVSDNSATVLQVPGQFPVAPTTSTGYQLQEPAVTFTGTAGTVQTPGSLTGGSLRATLAAQLIIRNNRSGFDSSLYSGAGPDGGSWAPIIVQGCHFRGSPSATMAAIALEGPAALLESRLDGFGSNGRMVVPTGTGGALVAARNSMDAPGARFVTFNRPGTEWLTAAFEQNVVVNLEYFVFGTEFAVGLFSHNNLFQTVSTTGGGGSVYRLTHSTDGYSFGDRINRAATFLRFPGGSYEQIGGSGQFHVDAISATNISVAFVNLSGRGGLHVSLNTGNGSYGAGASAVQLSAGARLALVAGNGTEFRWRHSNVTITEDGASSTLSSSVLFADNISGYPVARVDAATPHELCNARSACVGWVDDLNAPYAPILGFVGSGAGGESWAAEPVDVTLSSGAGSAAFSPAFYDEPTCLLTGMDGGVTGYAATDGGVSITGSATTRVKGVCFGPR